MLALPCYDGWRNDLPMNFESISVFFSYPCLMALDRRHGDFRLENIQALSIDGKTLSILAWKQLGFAV